MNIIEALKAEATKKGYLEAAPIRPISEEKSNDVTFEIQSDSMLFTHKGITYSINYNDIDIIQRYPRIRTYPAACSRNIENVSPHFREMYVLANIYCAFKKQAFNKTKLMDVRRTIGNICNNVNKSPISKLYLIERYYYEIITVFTSQEKTHIDNVINLLK